MIPWWAWAISAVLLLLVAACIVVALKILWRQLTDYNKPVKLFITLDDQTLDRMLKKC